MKNDVLFQRFFGDASQEYSEILKQGRVKLSESCYVDTQNMYFMEQIHSDNVVIIDDVDRTGSNVMPQCDGLVTSLKNTFVATKTADCFPVLLYDEEKEVVAVAHSGREGTRLKIVGKIIKIMVDRFLSKPENIKVEIGVGICPNHYPVSPEIVEDFREAFMTDDITESLDLQKLIIDTAIENNILRENIFPSSLCSFEDKGYFSFRRGENADRQISFIGMVYGRDI